MRFLTLVLVAAGLAACGTHHDHSGTGDGGADFDSIELDPPQATLTIALGGTAQQSYQVFGVKGGDRTDITASCALSIDGEFGTFTGSTVTVQGRGGKATVDAICGSAGNGSGSLLVNVKDQIVVAPAPANAPDLFGAATLGTDAARAPAVEYPLNNAVSPRNLPPIDIQWTAAGNDLFHTRVSSTYLAIDIYTTDNSAMLSVDQWEQVSRSAGGDRLQFAVEGLLQADPTMRFAGANTSIAVSNDNIDRTAIYYWASSAGNIMSQTFGQTTAPSLVKGGCTSCHSLSRTGSRIGYSRCIGGNCSYVYVGFMKYDGTTWNEQVNADAEQIHGSYTTFSPVGNPYPNDDRSAAIVAMADGSLQLYDADAGTVLTSNLGATSTSSGARAATMPDWSWDGKTVVFASTPHPGQWIDLSDSEIQTMSYSYDAATDTHTFGTPQTLVQGPITLPTGTYNNLFFPSFSPDGKLVVFDAARSPWRDAANGETVPGPRLMLAGADGSFVTELAAMNGPSGESDITWAHWAPDTQQDYYWVVFATERDYGHRITAANTAPGCVANGVKQCKQIWIGAIAKNRITGALTMDPSAPPMWLPGQDTQTDNISPFWTQPAGIQ